MGNKQSYFHHPTFKVSFCLVLFFNAFVFAFFIYKTLSLKKRSLVQKNDPKTGMTFHFLEYKNTGLVIFNPVFSKCLTSIFNHTMLLCWKYDLNSFVFSVNFQVLGEMPHMCTHVDSMWHPLILYWAFKLCLKSDICCSTEQHTVCGVSILCVC